MLFANYLLITIIQLLSNIPSNYIMLALQPILWFALMRLHFILLYWNQLQICYKARFKIGFLWDSMLVTYLIYYVENAVVALTIELKLLRMSTRHTHRCNVPLQQFWHIFRNFRHIFNSPEFKSIVFTSNRIGSWLFLF